MTRPDIERIGAEMCDNEYIDIGAGIDVLHYVRELEAAVGSYDRLVEQRDAELIAANRQTCAAVNRSQQLAAECDALGDRNAVVEDQVELYKDELCGLVLRILTLEEQLGTVSP